MSLLHPRKGWDNDDSSFMINGNFTHFGLIKYWNAIDATLHFWDSKAKPQIVQKMSTGSNKSVEGSSTDKDEQPRL